MNSSAHTPGHARKVPWGAFWRLVLIQAQNSFNEKGAQFLLIPLGVWLYGAEGDLEYPLGAIIVLPFILFSPFVGWLSDRFCKARIIQFMALLQICVLAGMYWSLRVHNLNGAILWFCVFAVQATVFSPAKKGIVKDIVGTSRMGFASGIVEMAFFHPQLAHRPDRRLHLVPLPAGAFHGYHLAPLAGGGLLPVV